MQSNYPLLLGPAKIGSMKLRNRIVMAAMGTHSHEPDGRMSKSMADYYEERARGGAGMVITEAAFVSNKLDPWQFHSTLADTEARTANWRYVAERITAHGARACIQLSCGLGKNAFPATDNDAPMVSASENECFWIPGQKTRALEIDEIKDLVGAFGRSASRAQRAGFDAIEVHAHQGYLIDQFMSEMWNRRTDEYGGSAENRMRLPVEIVQAIRAAVGPDYPIIFRISVDHCQEGFRTLEQTVPLLKRLEEEGVDAYNMSLGCYGSEMLGVGMPSIYTDRAKWASYAEELKKHVNIPILVAGGIDAKLGEEALEKGQLDFVLMGRALIADPHLPNKLVEGREEDIRPCIRCNYHCMRNIWAGLPISCSINPRVGAEKDYVLTPSRRRRRVAVVGGGPAGMEAARIAAIRGHDVTLYEKGPALGGQARAAVSSPYKKLLGEYVEYLKTQLYKLGVKVRTGVEITADSYELENADQIIVGVGAVPLKPEIPGIDGANVVDALDAHLQRDVVKGKKVLVAGGGLTGCDLALELTLEGHEVSIVEMAEDVALSEPDAGIRGELFEKMAIHGVKKYVGHKILAITEKGITAEDASGKTVELAGDTVVLAFGMKPLGTLAEQIFEKYPTARLLGDCTRIGQVGDAVRDGFFAGWAVH